MTSLDGHKDGGGLTGEGEEGLIPLAILVPLCVVGSLWVCCVIGCLVYAQLSNRRRRERNEQAERRGTVINHSRKSSYSARVKQTSSLSVGGKATVVKQSSKGEWARALGAMDNVPYLKNAGELRPGSAIDHMVRIEVQRSSSIDPDTSSFNRGQGSRPHTSPLTSPIQSQLSKDPRAGAVKTPKRSSSTDVLPFPSSSDQQILLELEEGKRGSTESLGKAKDKGKGKGKGKGGSGKAKPKSAGGGGGKGEKERGIQCLQAPLLRKLSSSADPTKSNIHLVESQGSVKQAYCPLVVPEAALTFQRGCSQTIISPQTSRSSGGAVWRSPGVSGHSGLDSSSGKKSSRSRSGKATSTSSRSGARRRSSARRRSAAARLKQAPRGAHAPRTSPAESDLTSDPAATKLTSSPLKTNPLIKMRDRMFEFMSWKRKVSIPLKVSTATPPVVSYAPSPTLSLKDFRRDAFGWPHMPITGSLGQSAERRNAVSVIVHCPDPIREGNEVSEQSNVSEVCHSEEIGKHDESQAMIVLDKEEYAGEITTTQ